MCLPRLRLRLRLRQGGVAVPRRLGGYSGLRRPARFERVWARGHGRAEETDRCAVSPRSTGEKGTAMKDDSRMTGRPPRPLSSLAHSLACAGFAPVARLFAIAALALAAGFAQPTGAAQTDYANFDHMSTGFPLDGLHLNLRCEQCHLNGVFTGTSKQCATC